MIAIYSNNQIEVDATKESFVLTLSKPGAYELAVRRSQFAAFPATDAHFRLIEKGTGVSIASRNVYSALSVKRKNMSGDVTVAIAEFTVPTATEVELHNIEAHKFRAKDRLIIMPRTGAEGVLLIFAIVLSGIATISGLISSIILIGRDM